MKAFYISDKAFVVGHVGRLTEAMACGLPVVALDAPNPWFAKGGTGDVLAGMITSLVAQGMAPFYAACAGVWLHSQAGERCGALLTASDLESQFAQLIRDLLGNSGRG